MDVLRENKVPYDVIRDAVEGIVAILVKSTKHLITFYQSDREDLVERLDPDEESNIDDIEPCDLPSITGKQGFDFSPELLAELAERRRELRRHVVKGYKQLSEELRRKDLIKQGVRFLFARLDDSGVIYSHRPVLEGGVMPFLCIILDDFTRAVIDREGIADQYRAEFFESYGYRYDVLKDEEVDTWCFDGILGKIVDGMESTDWRDKFNDLIV